MGRIFHKTEIISQNVYQEILRGRRLHGVRRTELRAIRASVTLVLLNDDSAPMTSPTLVVRGENDRIIPAKHAHMAALHMPDAKVVPLPKCGHWPQLEQAQEFNKALLAFLEQIKPREQQFSSS